MIVKNISIYPKNIEVSTLYIKISCKYHKDFYICEVSIVSSIHVNNYMHKIYDSQLSSYRTQVADF